ncbi:MAG: response regulator [Nanoarchaeota archaeon]
MFYVDDDIMCLMIFREFFRGKNISLDTFNNPVQAYEKLSKTIESYCLGFIDFRMPEMDGESLARKLREKSTIPLYLHTGTVFETDIEELLLEGIFQGYIRKPVSLSEVEKLILRHNLSRQS